ncbi:MAG: membrane protein insertase YidC [candidate division Zixibacteria bacterium]|nr:membrane protein insertase YidC [candidate division Zixibacteria bacterium]
MDKKTILLVVLLGMLVIFWIPIMTNLGLMKPMPPRQTPVAIDTLRVVDTTRNAVQPRDTTVAALVDTSGGVTAVLPQMENLPEDTIIVETDVWLVTLTNHGGGPVSLKLNDYNYNNNGPVEMLPECRQVTPDFMFLGGAFDAGKLVYQSSLPKGKYSVAGTPLEISYSFQKEGGATITKRYRFYQDRYDYDLVLTVDKRSGLGIEREYSFEWNNRLDPTELDLFSEYNTMWAMAYQGTERVKFDKYTDNKFNRTESGNTNWIANRSKYFTYILIPRSDTAVAAKASGLKEKIVTARGTFERRTLTTGLVMNIPQNETLSDSFTVFVGPIDYEILRGYGNNVLDIIDIGTTPVVGWIIKIFAIPIMWLLPRMYDIIPNYGVVIILFSLVIKLLTWPLSKKTVQSMMAMKEIQPKLEELKKKHKNNPQALNKEMMKLYKEHGVNPFSGCLPYLPQLPLFIALYSVFSATIVLRQAPFVLWWNDLSRGALSFTDPYIIMVIVMMVLMFVQQKMTMTDPKNKILIYIMPLFMGFIFYKAAAGLVLYWTCFSLFSFIEQLVVKPHKQPTVPVQQ